jgi:uncharacterized protein (TIGR02246 family)
MSDNKQCYPDERDDEAAIKKWFDKYLTSVAEGDLDTYLASWTDNMIFLPPNQRAKIGKESCREIAEGILRYDVEPKVKEQEISVSGDLAFARNLVSERFTPKGGGESYEAEFNSVFIFRRQADGSWIGTICIWNNTSP